MPSLRLVAPSCLRHVALRLIPQALPSAIDLEFFIKTGRRSVQKRGSALGGLPNWNFRFPSDASFVEKFDPTTLNAFEVLQSQIHQLIIDRFRMTMYEGVSCCLDPTQEQCFILEAGIP